METDIKSKLLKVATDASVAVMELYKKDYKVESKDDESPVTEADYKANDIISAGLQDFGYPIISEESPNDERRYESERVWIVDPLDGTRDFVNGTDEFSIMVALVENGRPILSVVAVPALDVIYYAEKGSGSFKENFVNKQEERINVSIIEDSRDARMIASRSHFSDDLQKLADDLEIEELLKVGSNGVKIGRIAENRADIFVTQAAKLGEWDLAAPQLILEEAGGRMTDLSGEEIIYNKEEPVHREGVVATNGALHQRVLSEL